MYLFSPTKLESFNRSRRDQPSGRNGTGGGGGGGPGNGGGFSSNFSGNFMGGGGMMMGNMGQNMGNMGRGGAGALNGAAFTESELMTDLPKKKFTGRCRLFVGNLPHEVKEAELKELFSPHGDIAECYLSGKGFAFLRLVTRLTFAYVFKKGGVERWYQGKVTEGAVC